MNSPRFQNTVSPFEEMVSYETLWEIPDASLKVVAEWFQKHPGLPSQLLQILSKQFIFADNLLEEVRSYVSKLNGFSVSVNRCFQYPSKLQSARYPIELFYYRGEIDVLESPCVSIVGARKASSDGLKRAARLSRELVAKGWTVVSGLAAGIDTAAMTAAIEAKGRTIGVIGTPINQSYPRENSDLQETVALRHLLVSQVPFYHYAKQHFKSRRYYFPQRNETMAALSQATIIVEASDTSGSLTQARACLQQGRKLFILNSCFENPEITWPHSYEKQGAVRVRTTSDIFEALEQ